MEWIVQTLVGLIPVALICAFVYLKDARRPEKIRHLLITFFLGMLLALPVQYIDGQLLDWEWRHSTELLPYALSILLGVALLQEFFKLLAVLLYPFHRSFFDEPLDGIVYAVYAAMGFSLVQIAWGGDFGWQGALTQAGIQVPANAAFAMISGYFFGRAIQAQNSGQRSIMVLKGFLSAVLAHWLFKALLYNPYEQWLMFVGVAVLFVTWLIAYMLLRRHAASDEPSPLANAEL